MLSCRCWTDTAVTLRRCFHRHWCRLCLHDFSLPPVAAVSWRRHAVPEMPAKWKWSQQKDMEKKPKHTHKTVFNPRLGFIHCDCWLQLSLLWSMRCEAAFCCVWCKGSATQHKRAAFRWSSVCTPSQAPPVHQHSYGNIKIKAEASGGEGGLKERRGAHFI